jgi:hypothetical protein
MKSVGALLSSALILVALCTAGQSHTQSRIGSSVAVTTPIPNETPAPTPTPVQSVVITIEAEDYASALGSVRRVHEADASGGQVIEPVDPFGNFVQFHFRVPAAGSYMLGLRYMADETSWIEGLIEGPELELGCENCTAGEWFGVNPLQSQPQSWVEVSVNLPELQADTTYTLTLRLHGQPRVDWLHVYN